MSDSSDEDSDWEMLGRGFPDLSRLSLKFQWDSFMTDLQQGTSLSGALNRLQTIKAKWDTMMISIPRYAELRGPEPHTDIGSVNHPTMENTEQNRDRERDFLAYVAPETIVENTDPTVVTKNRSHSHPMYTNDLVVPMDKEYTELTHWEAEFNNNEQALRARIKQIRALPDLTEIQKASMIQKLMMKHSTLPSDPNTGMGCSHDHVHEHTHTNVNDHFNTHSHSHSHGVDTIYDSNHDLPPPEPTEEDKKNIYHSPGVRGCPHYQRNCKLLCSQCNKWVSCRFCHDEQYPDHEFRREETKWVLCTNCFHYQEPSSHCDHCGIEFAIYYCPICKLYDNDETKDIYHCDKCGICRLGLGLGQDFFHCDQCNACLSIELLGNHKCTENSTRANCPVCHEYMFTSTSAVVYMDPCGHAIHQHCFDEYIKHSYKCPTCGVSVINMEREFRILSQEIQEYKLPEPYCFWRCQVHCNDCRQKSTVDYHILGLRCQHCGSYNTRQLQLIKPEELVEPRIEALDLASPDSSEGAVTPGSVMERRTTVSSFARDNEELQQLRDELLHSNFQRETVNLNSNWTLDQDKLRHMDDYLRAMVETDPADAGNADSDTGFAARIRTFFANQKPDVASLPQLSHAFAEFLGSTHQGLLSSDEDDT